MTIGPMTVSLSERLVVGLPVLSYALRHDFIAGKQAAVSDANEIVASGSRRSAISFYERMDPIQPPQGIGWKKSRMIQYSPILMNDGKELVHQMGNIIKMRRDVVSDIDRLLSKTSTKLRYVCGGCGIQ